MAQQHHQDTPAIGFQSIELLKAKTLGIGSYGSVCKALCDGLLCAGKVLHPTLFDPTAHQEIARHREHRLPIRRFEQECEFMSAIRHSNIVQYLGTCQDPETRLPVLLMELMDDSLTHFLESSQDPVPYHIQVNFCHDITLAISYLHLNSITHRDLSSNNVLLYGNVKAKVTDFGMAKLSDLNPQASFTTCPGTDAYMPPEAVRDQPAYTAKIDCFAIGTLVVQILTRKFPKPGDRHKLVETVDPQFPSGTVEVRVSEIERRQNHISEVDPNHPLLPIALDCLKDSDFERPSAQELCHRVAAQKETPQYTESAQEKTEREDEIAELQQQIEEKDDIIVEMGDIIQKKDDIIQEKDDVIQQKEVEFHKLRKRQADQIHDLQQTIRALQTCLQEKGDIIREQDDVTQRKDDEQYLLCKQYAQRIHELQQSIGTLKTRLQEKEVVLQVKDDIIQERYDVMQQKEEEIGQLKRKHSDQVQGLQQVIGMQSDRLQQIIQENEQTLFAKRREIRDKDQMIEERDRQLHQVTKQLEASRKEIAQFQAQIQQLDQQQQVVKPQSSPRMGRRTMTHPLDSTSGAVIRDSVKLRWRETKKAPCEMDRAANAVVEGNTVYLLNGGTRNVYGYNTTEGKWDTLPDCPTEGCSVAVVNSLLTTIGGITGGKVVTNQLFSLVGDVWEEVFQPMPTKRWGTVTVCSAKSPIVAGGVDQDGKELKTVEVMDIATQQWSTAADLPGPLCEASVTICGDRIYTLGGWSNVFSQSKSVYTCSLSDLFQSCQSKSLGARLRAKIGQSNARSTVWEKVADLPVYQATCVTRHGRLLAIGGHEYDEPPTSDVRIYRPTSNTWVVVSKMSTSRRLCYAAVLPSNDVMVVGGVTIQSGETDLVEIGSSA